MPAVLVTGFGPYANTPVNPAQLTAEALDGRTIAGVPVVSRIVSNAYFDAIADTVAAVEEVGPELLVMLGEYGGRSMITVERLAQNLNDCARYGVADTAGKVLNGEPTAPDGPVAYYSTAPVRAMVLAMREAGIPADISDAAGTFVCNHLMYGMLHHIATNGLPIRASWIHLPYLPEIAALDRNLGAPSMSVQTAAAGVAAGIEAALCHRVDVSDPVHSLLQI
ncbi:pyroglutamyl-peptidase I [Mycobacterium sp. Y57]|uniref:pyroglutamyl-peptidase I n=1 Tax=Mycolicibacterium xanthum TaxID=2796469 RepID=UPI001C855A78|nr:pyroglutamyl-peptidase I [Mycolicibacterium xanthum]MBX7435098.1 pyroglutamyl-peptidase I [Mycolicibacterium xanthum]